MKECDKFTKLLLKDNIEKEKNWDNRFILEKIPQYDAYKDPNYLSLSLLKSKNKMEEKTNSNKAKKNQKKRVYSHYTINSLTKKIPVQAKKNYDESFNNKNSQLNNPKRPFSKYLNRNHLSFMTNINNSNSNMDTNTNNNTNQNIFYNFITNKLKTQNNNSNSNNNLNLNINNNNNDLYSINDKFTSKTTKNNDIKNIKNYIIFRESSYNNLDNNYSAINNEQNLLNELNNIKEIWNEIYVTQEYQNLFEEMINQLNNKEEVENLLNYEKKQIIQFKNELLKLLNVISKREKGIENIKKLDKIYIENKKLTQYNKLLIEKNKSDPNINTNNENIYDNEELEEKNKQQIEDDIHNCLKLLRINSVNVIHQFNKFRTMNNYLITSDKIDMNKIKKNYGYNKDYLIKMKNDLDFLVYSNIYLIYNFKTHDPFLLSLIPDKNEKGGKFKKIPVSEELMSTINNSLYILAQEELLFKMKFKKEIKRNKSHGFEEKENKINNDEININNNIKNNIKNNSNKEKKNINILKLKSNRDYNKLFFQNNKNSDLNLNINDNNGIKKIKNLYFNNQLNLNKDNKKLKEIPATTASQLKKKFDFYNKLKEDISPDEKKDNNNKENKNDDNKKEDKNEPDNKEDKNENNNKEEKNENNNKEEKNENNNKEEKNENNNDNKIEESNKKEEKKDEENEKIDISKLNYNWYNDSFNKFKNLYNEYYNKLTKKTIELFSVNINADEFICGINPKILICQQENNKIYGICGLSFYYENNKLILKINHLSSLEISNNNEEVNSLKEKSEFKIYDNFINLIKSVPYEIIELNLFINEENKNILDYFMNEYKFEIYNENKNNKNENNNNGENEENNMENKINEKNGEENENEENKNIYGKKILRLYNNNYDNNDEIIKKLIESSELKYNNTSILSLVEEDNINNINNDETENNIVKYNNIYKYINTFNVNILINFLTKDNTYNISSSSNEPLSLLSDDFSKYSSLFIKDQNNNSDSIINISPDCSLIETKDKIKYAYITSLLNIKIYPFISTIYNKIAYNIFKIDIKQFNKEKKIYIIPTSDEKISFYIYQCEEETEINKEINKNENENFNIFEYFNKLINDNNVDNNENKEDNNNNEEYNFDENKNLWLPSFSIDTQLICGKIPILKHIIIKNNEDKNIKIKEYTEILKIKYGIKELNNNDFIYEPNINEDIIIDKDFIFAISHKDIKNQFNNSIVFLTYITKDNFINTT